MSTRNNNKKQMTVKPFCKVCHDAGKSEKEYTSHFVKSAPGPEGKVVCPTLLNQTCGYCGSCGHTPKFCQVLASHKAAEEKALKHATHIQALEKREAQKLVPTKLGPVKKCQSSFAAAFGGDSDSETEQKVSKKKVSKKVSIKAPKSGTKILDNVNEFPALPKITSKTDNKVTAKLATKLLANVDEFPPLPKITPKTDNKVAAKSQAKSCLLAAIINHTCPELKVPEKMPKVNTYRPIIAQLVRRKCVEGLEPERGEHEKNSETESDQETDEEFYESTNYQRAPMKASEMNWAAAYPSDSDEDW